MTKILNLRAGIPIGQGRPIQNLRIEQYTNFVNTINEFFPEIHIQRFTGAGIPVSDLKKYIENFVKVEPLPDYMSPIIARAFWFYVLGSVFFPNAHSTSDLGYLHYLEDIPAIGTYDWGSAIYARILWSLDKASRRSLTSVECMWQILEVYYRFILFIKIYVSLQYMSTYSNELNLLTNFAVFTSRVHGHGMSYSRRSVHRCVAPHIPLVEGEPKKSQGSTVVSHLKQSTSA